MKLFECIIDDDEQGVFKAFLAAKNKKELTENFIDVGRFDKVTDVTDVYLVPESVVLLREHLSEKGWGQAETEIICSLVAEHIKERDENKQNGYLVEEYFAEKARIAQESDKTLETILSRSYNNFDQYEEVNNIMDLDVAKVIIKRLLDKIN